MPSLFILGFLLLFLFGNQTVTVKNTSTDSTQGQCGAEKRPQVAPMARPIAIMPSTLVKRQEHPPPRRAPEKKILSAIWRQCTVARLGSEAYQEPTNVRKK